MAWQPKPSQWFVIGVAFLLAFLVIVDTSPYLLTSSLTLAVFIMLGGALFAWFLQGKPRRPKPAESPQPPPTEPDPISPKVRSAWEILEVSPNATLAEIRKAYKHLTQVWHPDRFAHDPQLQRRAQEKLKEINFAYELLQTRGGAGTTAKQQRSHPRGTSPPSHVRPPAHQRSHSKEQSRTVLTVIVIALGLILVGVVQIALDPQGQGDSRLVNGSSTVEIGQRFTIGSSKDQVFKIQGPPTDFSDTRWNYSDSWVEFTDDQVIGWHRSGSREIGQSLWVRLAPAQGSFVDSVTVGSTKDEVLAAHGTPDTVLSNRFGYREAWIEFDEGGRVVGWHEEEASRLRVYLLSEQALRNPLIVVGSSKDEVLVIQGTPSDLSSTRFGYGASWVEFENDQVVKWHSDETNPLHVKP